MSLRLWWSSHLIVLTPRSHFRQPFDLFRHPRTLSSHPRWTLAWNNLTENVSMFDLGNWKPFGLSLVPWDLSASISSQWELLRASSPFWLISHLTDADIDDTMCYWAGKIIIIFPTLFSPLFFFIASHSSPFAHVSGRERDRWRLQITSLMPSWFKQQHTWLSDDMAEWEHTHHDRMRNALRNFHVFLLLLNTQNSKSMEEMQKTAEEEKKNSNSA